jgi:hypothetical protein
MNEKHSGDIEETATVLSQSKPAEKTLAAHSDDQEREAAKIRLLTRLRHQKPTGLPQDWNRNELYENN